MGQLGYILVSPRPQTQYLLHPPRHLATPPPLPALPSLPLPPTLSRLLCRVATSTPVSRRTAALPLLFLCGNVCRCRCNRSVMTRNSECGRAGVYFKHSCLLGTQASLASTSPCSPVFKCVYCAELLSHGEHA